MKYLFWILLSVAATCVFAMETFICKYTDDGYYICNLIKDDTSNDPPGLVLKSDD